VDPAKISPLVERLRLMHEERVRKPGNAPAASAATTGTEIPQRSKPAASPSPARPDPFVAKALRALKQIAVLRSGDLGASGDTSPYGDIQRLLFHRDPAARRRQALIERVLDQLEAGRPVDTIDSPSPLQQELRLVVSANGSGGGRFLVANETSEPVQVRFEARPIRSPAPTAMNHASLSFEPAEPRLDVGEIRTVAITVQLEPPHLDGGLELAVRVLAENRILGRLWVELLPSPQLERED